LSLSRTITGCASNKSCRNKWFENTGGLIIRVRSTGQVKGPTESMLSQVLYEFALLNRAAQSFQKLLTVCIDSTENLRYVLYTSSMCHSNQRYKEKSGHGKSFF
jgi:hypothetical protein